MDKLKLITEIEKQLQSYEAKKDENYKNKLLFANGLLIGKDVKTCCMEYNVKVATGYRIKNKLKETNGIDFLMTNRGRPSKLSEEQLVTIEEILENPATKFGFRNGEWTGEILSEHINENFGVDISIRKAQDILNNSFYYNNRKQNTKNNSDPEYISTITDGRENIWFLLVFKAWEKKNQKMALTTKPKRLVYYMALDYKGNRLFLREKKSKSYNTLVEFILELIDNCFTTTKKYTLIMSNSPINKRLRTELNLVDLNGIDLEVILYNIKGAKLKSSKDILEDDYFDGNYYYEFNPLYNLKMDILNLIKKSEKYYINSVNKRTKTAIKALIREKYNLY